MKRVTIVLFSILAITGVTLGQITIDFLEMPFNWGIESSFYTESDTAGGIPVNVGQASGNQFWDFALGDTVTDFSQTIVSVDSTPFAALFQDAELVMETDDLVPFGFEGPGFLYYQLLPSAMNMLGMGVDVEGMSLPIRFETPMTWYPMPLDYQDDWDNSIFVQVYYDTAGQTYRIDIDIDFDSQADAWGDVAVPLNTLETLRVRNDIAIDLTVYLILWGIPIEIYHEEYSYINYTWVCENQGMTALIMSQEGETNPNFTLASAYARLYEVISGDYTITFAPLNPPIIIPAGGGNFTYDGTIHNNMSQTGQFDFWTGVYLPNGNYYGPLLNRTGLSLSAGMTIARQLTQTVPGGAPAGLYYYVGFLGNSQNQIVKAQGGFTFTKTN
ncbi:hypothetical protein ISS30_04270 [bacterium]|nr:hypothetical protein [bacterium]